MRGGGWGEVGGVGWRWAGSGGGGGVCVCVEAVLIFEIKEIGISTRPTKSDLHLPTGQCCIVALWIAWND